jgi:hypothetical protein
VLAKSSADSSQYAPGPISDKLTQEAGRNNILFNWGRPGEGVIWHHSCYAGVYCHWFQLEAAVQAFSIAERTCNIGEGRGVRKLVGIGKSMKEV